MFGTWDKFRLVMSNGVGKVRYKCFKDIKTTMTIFTLVVGRFLTAICLDSPKPYNNGSALES